MIGLTVTFYIIFLAAFAVLSFFALYQLWHFGYVGDVSKRMIVAYLVISGVVVIGSFVAYFIFV